MRLAVVAGELSGDLLGAGLVRALRARVAGLECEGVCGPGLEDAGCTGLYPMQRLSVVGLVEGLRRVPELLPARRRLVARWGSQPPDVFVGIDAPDFNLGLERRLRARGVPTVHYVSPSVWAWRRYRVRKVARSVDRLLVLFPFEADFYALHGVPARFVGHPLADRIPMEPDVGAARRALGLPEGGEWVALLPGSRVGEVARLAGPLIGAAHWLRERRPGVGFLVPAASPETRAAFEAALGGRGQDLPLRLFDGRGHTVMAAADVVLLASGTATLEALLLKRPMVVTYRLSALTYALAKRLVRVPHVGLPNLLAGRELVPELLQDRATPEGLGTAVLRYLEAPSAVAALQESFRDIHQALRRGADDRAAEAVLELLDRPGLSERRAPSRARERPASPLRLRR
ncbi:MAG: lipid-A-disaccharide synthase [Gammaproteobacteria bacterium]|nr:lipid-A-disaccharide synthase [Gammaproteobacteria bacterium]